MIIKCDRCGKEIELRITNVLEQRINIMIESLQSDLKNIDLTPDSKIEHIFGIGLLRTILQPETKEIIKSG